MENRNNNPIAEEIIHNNPTGYRCGLCQCGHVYVGRRQ